MTAGVQSNFKLTPHFNVGQKGNHTPSQPPKGVELTS